MRIANEDGSKALFTVVPKALLLSVLSDDELINEVKELYRQGRAMNPIDYKAEERFIRRIYPRIFLSKQAKSFKPYLEQRS